eukprot:gene1349-2601_t
MSEAKNLSGIFSGAISRLGSLQNNVNINKAEVKEATIKQELVPQDIPYDELMQLCMKLNKRMQAMETRGQEMSRRMKTVNGEKIQLLELISEIVGQPVTFNDDQVVDIEIVRRMWIEVDDAKQSKMHELEDKIAANSSSNMKIKNNDVHTEDHQDKEEMIQLPDTKIDVENLIKTKRQLEVDLERSKASEITLRKLIHTLEQHLEEKSTKVDSLVKQMEAEHQSHEEKLIHFQMQLTAYKHKDELKENELITCRLQLQETVSELTSLQQLTTQKEDALKASNDKVSHLQQRVTSLESALQKGKDKLRDFEKNSNAASFLKVEQEALLHSLRKELKIALESKDELSRRVDALMEQCSASESTQYRLAEGLQRISALELELDERTGLITRMRTEVQAAEKNHGIRTAMLAAAEAEIASLTQQLQQKQLTEEDSSTRMTTLQLKKATERAAEDARHFEVTLETLKAEHAAANDSLQKEFAKKSTAARNLLAEKDVELEALKKHVETLQAEIDSGAHNERRIFELAQQQANREASYGAHSDTRDIAFQQIQSALAARDLSLARLQHAHTVLSSEVTELRRVRKREGVNMDYLKNIVIQFMSFPTNSPERCSLVPVIAMLLQFSVDEVMAIEQSMKAPLPWSARPVKEVKHCSPSPRGSPTLRTRPGGEGVPGGATSPNSRQTSPSTSISSPSISSTLVSSSLPLENVSPQPGERNKEQDKETGQGQGPRYSDPQAV